MEQVLSRLPMSVALIYIDDILSPGNTFNDHLTDLCTVFKCIRGTKLKLAPPKCILLQPKVSYHGHVISGDGISSHQYVAIPNFYYSIEKLPGSLFFLQEIHSLHC